MTTKVKSKKSGGQLVVRLDYETILSAIQEWQPSQVNMLITDLQVVAQQKNEDRSNWASVAEMMSIVPLDVVPPTDEEVKEMLMEARLERLGMK